MTRAIDDLTGRLQGATAGIIGYKDRASGPDKPASTSAEGQAPYVVHFVPPAPEDVAKFKQMLEEVKGIAEAMLAEYNKEHPPAGEHPTPTTGGSKTKT